ncbi:MAG: hypothetical protein LC641_00410, partial [Spirochaeta sp.]|nr:hypothetical protein [Spirochaeta sp.]
MRGVITVGGIGVIAAVSLVFVFLASVVIPLFRGTSFEPAAVYSLDRNASNAHTYMAVDEFMIAGLVSDDDGRGLRHIRLDSGENIGYFNIFDRTPSAVSYTPSDGWLTAGFDDGSTAIGQVVFETDFYELTDPRMASLSDLEVGEVALFEGNVAQRTDVGQIRVQRPVITMSEPISAGGSSSIELIDKTITSSGPIIATVSEDGRLRVNTVSERRNILTGVVTTTLSGGKIDLTDNFAVHPDPAAVLVNAIGTNIFMVWKDGYYTRLDVRDLENIEIVESGQLLEDDSAAEITKVTFLLGQGTLLVGDSLGRVRTWFLARTPETETPDTLSLVNAAEFEGPVAVTSIASSSRKRLISVGYADGTVASFYVTSSALLGRMNVFDGSSVEGIVIAPKNDAVIGISLNTLGIFSLKASHPEATSSSIFGEIWYEGNSEPKHSWQSSSGTDTFEPKYGLVPLIFGTLKATFYSLLFGIPIALLAAIYTSEFLDPKLRGRIKPAVEMMASLPSVVLGFLAGLVFAPFVEN